MIIYNGISSEEIGVIVEHYPSFTVPQRRYTVVEVPGRNGNIVIDDGSYSNYEQRFEVFLDAKDKGGLPAVVQRLSKWLNAGGGYKKLEDSYSENTYRLAYIENAIEFSNYFNIYGKGTLVFNSMPQRYLKSGDQEIAMSNYLYNNDERYLTTMSLFNPTDYYSDPIIRFHGASFDKIIVNRDGKTATIDIDLNTTASQDVYVIDVANHIFTQNGVSAMQGFIGNFEDLKLGKETSFSFYVNAGSLTSVFVKVTPRWWTL